jgi:hypothetical protein
VVLVYPGEWRQDKAALRRNLARQLYQKLGMCQNCHRNITEESKRYCKRHLEKYRQAHREGSRKSYREAKANHICPRCKVPTYGTVYCGDCQAVLRASLMKSRKRHPKERRKPRVITKQTMAGVKAYFEKKRLEGLDKKECGPTFSGEGLKPEEEMEK